MVLAWIVRDLERGVEIKSQDESKSLLLCGKMDETKFLQIIDAMVARPPMYFGNREGFLREVGAFALGIDVAHGYAGEASIVPDAFVAPVCEQVPYPAGGGAVLGHADRARRGLRARGVAALRAALAGVPREIARRLTALRLPGRPTWSQRNPAMQPDTVNPEIRYEALGGASPAVASGVWRNATFDFRARHDDWDFVLPDNPWLRVSPSEIVLKLG